MEMLEYAGCRNSDADAALAKDMLWVDRDWAALQGWKMLRVGEKGGYWTPSGRWIDLRPALGATMHRRRSIPPDAAVGVPAPRGVTRVSVVNAPTLAAAAELRGGSGVAVLNFAAGRTPGGGFLDGSRAQEEYLCRSSLLYRVLEGDPMYDAHRGGGDGYSDWCIWTPGIPVVRDDWGEPLEQPWRVDVLTCAAPKVGDGCSQDEGARLMESRIPRVLDVFASRGARKLVLGAWGCGAFHNDPVRVARIFREALEDRAGVFDTVVFAIKDWSQDRGTIGAFHVEFENIVKD